VIGGDRSTGLSAQARRTVRRALPWILIATVVVNLAMSRRYVPPSGHPIRTTAGPELSALVRASQPLTRDLYLLYADLADVAAGSVLVVPDGHTLDHRLVRGIGGMTVEVRDYDPTVDDGAFDLSTRPLGGVVTPGGVVDYWIVPGSAGVWWLGRIGDSGIVIVPESVAPVPGDGR
jgi:hypothetical protein